MTKSILFVTTLALTCATAQTEPTPAAMTASTVVTPSLSEPISTTTPDNTRYLLKPALLTGCVGQVNAIKGKPCDIIFIGDSITANWIGAGKAVWAKSYGTRNPLNFGIGGDKTQNVLWRLENMDVKDLKPKVAVILIGTNNTKNTPQEIADGVKAVLAKTQATFANVKIILVSIMPSKRANDKMMATNAIIKGYADSQSIYWLDLVPLMSVMTTTALDGTIDTNWKGLGKDHLHPDASGYQIWADAIEPLLANLLTGP